MSYIFYNPNPAGKIVEDCVFRALSIVLEMDWRDVYIRLSEIGLMESDRPDANLVWGKMLIENGFKRHAIPNSCPQCYTVYQFAIDHPKGVYVLATGTHVIALIDGIYYDTMDSGDYVPIYYWTRDR